MGVYTTADRNRDEALEHINKAIRLVSEIVSEDCWGHDDYTREYIKRLNMALIYLVGAKREMA